MNISHRFLRTIKLPLMFLVAFIPRFITWIYPGLGWGRLVIYDVQLYTDCGRAMIEAVSEWNIEKFVSINVGVPPLGTFLVGISTLTFRAWLDVYRAGLLAPIIASSTSAPLIYLILHKHSEKAGLVAALVFSLDPYLVQFSSAYLDAIGAFFLLVAMFFFITSKELSFRKCLLIGFFLMTSILTKFTFAIFAAFFIIFLVLVKKDLRAAGIMATISIIPVMLVPWLCFPRTFQVAFTSHMTMNSLLPPIIFGPIMIGVMESYPWYILTYLGLGQVHWGVLPSISHIMLFSEIIYAFLRRDSRINENLTIFVVSSILAIAFIPRNYWTYSWGGGFLKSESVLFKQFCPYYFYPVNLASGILASDMMFDKDYSNNFRTRIIVFPIILYSLTAPFTVIMNWLYPYWDFIFTLILNFSRGNPIVGYYGLIALMMTLLTLIALIMLTALILKRGLLETFKH
ncbi:hypothetical protein DRO64_05880 [Candidatus Bathyarchaeota archaeon]|nr:MAG: hypothetical protein DRO64_05880 [Candidatus Bathyarchaeota archaeon]